MIAIVTYIISSIVILLGLILLIRNEWVLKTRMKLLSDMRRVDHNTIFSGRSNERWFITDFERIFWSYDKMVWHFWVTDISKMTYDSDRYIELLHKLQDLRSNQDG